ncbi:MAG TPA: hypothetical protein VHR84_11470 [Terriglobales bacterium]|jgi:hypothetical protein|nr:hypothetical protein [Terriglobales bacterium]
MAKRTAKQERQIRQLCELEGVDPQHMLDNPAYDVLEVVRVLRMIRSVRAAMNARRI